jgi:hypothetical protein
MLLVATAISLSAVAVAASFLHTAACAVLIAAAAFRVAHPNVKSGRLAQIAAGGAACAIGIPALVLFGLGMLQFRTGAGTAPGWAIAIVVVWVLGHLCGIASGIVGLSTVNRGQPRTVRLTVTLLSLAGMCILLVTFVILSIQVSGLLPAQYGEGRFIVVQFLRAIVVAYELAGLLAMGIWELLICHADHLQSARTASEMSPSEVRTC